MSHSVPLVTDLDGSLLRSDLLYETLFSALKRNFWIILLLPLWVLQGRAVLKRNLALRSRLDFATLPYNQSVFELLRAEKARGRQVVLASASDIILVREVAKHFGVFTEVIGSNGSYNLKGPAKAEVLVRRFGRHNFDYIGDGHSDWPVWKDSRRQTLVTEREDFRRQMLNEFPSATVVFHENNRRRAWRHAFRVHQWVKNLLLFVPLVAAHRFTDLGALLSVVTAFFAFSLCASSVYLLNDLLDLDSDRQHPTKRKRPFAAGTLGIERGVLVMPLLLAAAWVLAFSVPVAFLGALTVYYVLTLSYSLWLKQQMMLDIVALSLLYSIRIWAGERRRMFQ